MPPTAVPDGGSAGAISPASSHSAASRTRRAARGIARTSGGATGGGPWTAGPGWASTHAASARRRRTRCRGVSAASPPARASASSPTSRYATSPARSNAPRAARRPPTSRSTRRTSPLGMASVYGTLSSRSGYTSSANARARSKRARSAGSVIADRAAVTASSRRLGTSPICSTAWCEASSASTRSSRSASCGEPGSRSIVPRPQRASHASSRGPAGVRRTASRPCSTTPAGRSRAIATSSRAGAVVVVDSPPSRSSTWPSPQASTSAHTRCSSKRPTLPGTKSWKWILMCGSTTSSTTRRSSVSSAPSVRLPRSTARAWSMRSRHSARHRSSHRRGYTSTFALAAAASATRRRNSGTTRQAIASTHHGGGAPGRCLPSRSTSCM